MAYPNNIYKNTIVKEKKLSVIEVSNITDRQTAITGTMPELLVYFKSILESGAACRGAGTRKINTSTPGLGLMLWIEKLYGDKSTDAWKAMAGKTLTVTKGWSEAYGLFLKGEGDFVLSYTSSPGYQILNDNKDNYAAALFDEGHYMQVEVAARLKNSPEPELAKQFLQFMLTPDFQNTLATTNWMYPVIDIPLPEVYSVLPLPKKSLQFSAQEVAKERQSWTRLWQSAVSR